MAGDRSFINHHWSCRTASGVMGDATKATREKGDKFLEAAIEGLIELVRELKATEILPRRRQHQKDSAEQAARPS
jgi:creatinine amidohydrolase